VVIIICSINISSILINNIGLKFLVTLFRGTRGSSLQEAFGTSGRSVGAHLQTPGFTSISQEAGFCPIFNLWIIILFQLVNLVTNS